MAGGANKTLFHAIMPVDEQQSSEEEDDEDFYKNGNNSDSDKNSASMKLPGAQAGVSTKVGQSERDQMNSSQTSMRASSRDSNRDFRIKSVSATTSSQQKATVPKPIKQTFKGLTKPH
jgi:hypothetical protein